MNLPQKIKKRLLQEKILFQESGFKNYYYRIRKKIEKIKFYYRIKHIDFDKYKFQHQQISKILIISGCEKTVAEIHRVFHISERLNILKIKNDILPHSKLESSNPKKLVEYDLIWIHRAGSEPSIDAMMRVWKRIGIPVLYDIDDLVFDKDIIKYISAIKDWSKEKKLLYVESMNRYSKIINQSNILSSPTNYLSNYLAKKYNKPSVVIRNGIDQKSYQKFLKNKPNKSKRKIVLGYFSGTNTHDQDFKSCSSAISNLMEIHQNLFLKIVGLLEIPKELEKFSNRIIRKSLVPYQKLFKEYQDTSINLAPLEINNPYCESKSELKYYFAGFCGIPTVASPTDSFCFAISDGQDGFLAKNKTDWFQKINQLITNKNLYNKISINSKKNCIKLYSPINQAKDLKQIIKFIQNESSN